MAKKILFIHIQNYFFIKLNKLYINNQWVAVNQTQERVNWIKTCSQSIPLAVIILTSKRSKKLSRFNRISGVNKIEKMSRILKMFNKNIVLRNK